MSEQADLLSTIHSKQDNVYLAFHLGEFAVLFGHRLCRTLSLRLSVRCQSPVSDGGLGSCAVYIDCGNTFNPYVVSLLAQEYDLQPESVLEQIVIARAFTVYQLATLILDELMAVMETYRAKLVIVADITRLFLDRSVPQLEGRAIFLNLIQYLAGLTSNRRSIIIASCFPHFPSRRNVLLTTLLSRRATRTINLKQLGAVSTAVLPGHPPLNPFVCALNVPARRDTACASLDMFFEET